MQRVADIAVFHDIAEGRVAAEGLVGVAVAASGTIEILKVAARPWVNRFFQDHNRTAVAAAEANAMKTESVFVKNFIFYSDASRCKWLGTKSNYPAKFGQ